MMITGNTLVIIYYCAEVAWAEGHNKILQIHTTSSFTNKMKHVQLYHILRPPHFSDNKNELIKKDENYEWLWKWQLHLTTWMIRWVCLISIKACGGKEVSHHWFSSSALGSKWSTLHPGCFAHSLNRRLGRPQRWSGCFGKKRILLCLDKKPVNCRGLSNQT